MAVDIKVPSVGESISEGNIARWVKKNGDFVKVDETLFELETEKATQDIPAPVSGILQIRVGEGQTVAIGAVVGSIEPASAPAGGNSTAAPTPASAAPAPEKKEPTGPHVSPAAAALIAEHKLDAVQIAGTGKHGVILKEDVDAYLAKAKAPAPAPVATPVAPVAAKPAPGSRETRERMSAIRARIADRLLSSQKTTASLTTFNEVDMQAVMDLRAKYKDRFKEKHSVGLGFMSFFVKAAVEALKAYPLVNASIDGSDIVYHHFYNVGVAVSTEKGLMVPVLADADKLSFADVEKNIGSLAVRARDGKIKVDELQGGTFTITNGGIFGSMMSTPILNPPQAAILGMHSINKRAMVKDDQIVIRPMMYLALTYDHRLIDGREAVLFLVRIKECIENPERMLLEV